MSETAIDEVPPTGAAGGPRSTRSDVLKEAGGVLSVLGTCGAVDLALGVHDVDPVGWLADMETGPSTVLFLLLVAIGIGYIGWRNHRPRPVAPLILSTYWIGALLGWRALVQVDGGQNAPLVPVAFGGVMVLGAYVARWLLKNLSDDVEPVDMRLGPTPAIEDSVTPSSTAPASVTETSVEALVEPGPTGGRGRLGSVGSAFLCIVLLLALVAAARPQAEEVTVTAPAATTSSPDPPDPGTPSTTSTTAPPVTAPPQDPHTCVEPKWGSGLDDASVRESILARAVVENLGCPQADADLVHNLAVQWSSDGTRAITYEYVSHTVAVVDDVFVREWVDRWGSLDMRHVEAESMERTTCRGIGLWLLRDPKRVVISAFLELPTPAGTHSYAFLPPRIWLWWWYQLIADGVGPIPDDADAVQSPPSSPTMTMSFDGKMREFEEARPSTDQFPATDEVLSVCARPAA